MLLGMFPPWLYFTQHVLLLAVPPKAGGGSGETAHQAAEDLGGAESLPEAAREVGKHELQGDQESLHQLPPPFHHHRHHHHRHRQCFENMHLRSTLCKPHLRWGLPADSPTKDLLFSPKVNLALLQHSQLQTFDFRKDDPASRLLRNTWPWQKVCGVRCQLGRPGVQQDCWSNHLQV